MIARAAAALTWDGARYPKRKLPARARAFLGTATRNAQLASLLKHNPLELRICWVPALKGGPAVLCPPFTTPTGKRIPFRLVRTVAFGPVLGAVYRRGA